LQSGWTRPRTAALITALAVALGSACSSSGAGSATTPPLTPADVQRYVLAKEGTADLTRLLYLIQSADSTVQHFSHQRPGSPASRRFLYGARVGWNNVAVGLNYFTQGQAVVVHQLTGMVGTHKLVSTAWLNTLDGLGKHPATSRRQLLKLLAGPQKQELAARQLLNDAAAALSEVTCSLEATHPELAIAADAATACDSAKQLAAPPST
jgi:hypothetical protein